MNDRRRFVRPWLWSAAIVVIVRLLHAADIDYDVTLQVQAGQHLVQGKGLSVYWPTADDIAKPLTLEELTQFAFGYSLYTAALTAAGVTDLGVVIKISGAIATLVGWWGWARLAYPYMAEGMRQHRLWRVAGLWIAVTCPILFTGRWGGTDILFGRPFHGPSNSSFGGRISWQALSLAQDCWHVMRPSSSLPTPLQSSYGNAHGAG